MRYDYHSKNQGKDFIYKTRLKLFDQLKINPLKNRKIFAYYQNANLGIVLQ